MALTDVFNRYAPLKRFARVFYRASQFVESAEANEEQDIVFERLGALGNTILGDINVRRGGTVVIDAATGIVRLGESEIWAGEYLHKVPAATLVGVPMVGVVVIGISVTAVVVDDIADPSLKGIVTGTQSDGEPLGLRLRYDSVWARNGDPFYPVHTIIDGAIPNEVTPPSNDVAELLVERHLRETHGSHISEGFRVSPGGFDAVSKEQTYIIGAGVLRAEGRRVSRTVDQRYRRVENPELVQVNGESHAFPAGGVVTLNNGPIDSVQLVTVIRSATRNITHQLAGGTDNLPDNPVYAIQSITQGATTFVAGTDYVRAGEGISWAPGGAEPAPGTTYTVNYQFTATVTADVTFGRNAITIPGAAVVGQPVTILYRYKLPRIDVLAIDLEGSVVYIEGIPSKYNPVPPPVPMPLAPLARIENRWGIDPIITDVDQRKLTEAEVRGLLRTLLVLADQVSLVTLERDIQERDPASRRGSFVDPFESDRQRDMGIAQDAAIVAGVLQLPVAVVAQTVDIGDGPIMLPYVTEAVISQPFRTLGRKINRYLNFSPLPAILALKPAVDRWNERQSTSSSSSSSSFAQQFSYRPDLVGTAAYGTTSVSTSSSSSTSVSRTTEDLPFLRPITVEYTARLMGPGEALQRLTFDGLDVTASVTGTKVANGQGVLTGTFQIPGNVKAGTKAVVALGAGGSRGETSFVGQGTLTIEHYHTSSHSHTVAVTIDPVAQSFVLAEPRQITGIKVEFTAKGSTANHIVIELRDMDGGLPGTITYAEGSTPGTFAIGNPLVAKPENWTEIFVRTPTLVPAKSWRWFCILTDDAEHSVAVAQLGDQSDANAPRGFDARRQEWIRENPALGDFADGSNNVSYRLEPGTDLTHEVMAARYTQLTRTVVLGSFDLGALHGGGGVSDVIVLLLVEEPSQATRVRLEMVRASGEVIAFEPNVALRLDQYLTEQVTIRMVLTGTPTLSPIVMPECQILWGRLKETARYVSEANTIDQTGGPVKLRTVAEVNAPGSSSVSLAIGDEDAWDTQTVAVARALGDGWIEREHMESPYAALEARTQILLAGTPKDRPLVRQLRQRATEV